MDARTGVQPQQPSKSAWNGAAVGVPPQGRAAAVAEPDAPARGVGSARSREANDGTASGSRERMSVDPMRATDRYRLVMPYSEGV